MPDTTPKPKPQHTPGPWSIEDGEIRADDPGVVIGQVYGVDDFPCMDPEDEN